MAQYFNSEEDPESSGCRPNVIIRDGVEFSSDPSKRWKEGIKHVAGGFGLAFLSFVAFYLIMCFFDVSFIIRSFVALIFSFLTIKAYDKATGEMPTPKNGAVANFTIIFFVLSLFLGYQFSDVKIFEKKTVVENNLSSESGTIRSVGEVWFASYVFSKGDKIRIEVEYNPVQMTGGRVFEPGVYEDEVVNSDGQVMFEGIATNPTKITITY